MFFSAFNFNPNKHCKFLDTRWQKMYYFPFEHINFK